MRRFVATIVCVVLTPPLWILTIGCFTARRFIDGILLLTEIMQAVKERAAAIRYGG